MTIISVCSAKGAPGVTTISCAIAAVWPTNREIVVAECDPSGGDLAARFGLSAKRGMTSLVLDARHSTSGLAFQMYEHVQMLPGGLEVLVGPTGAGASRTVDSQLPECLKRLLEQRQRDTERDPESAPDLVLDCGRIQPGATGQVAAVAVSDHVLVVTRPTLEAVASTRWIADRLNRADGNGSSAGLVLSGNGPAPALEAASALELELLAVVPDDRVGAAALRGDAIRSGRLARSALVSSARSLVAALLVKTADAARPGLAHQALSEVMS
jgi:MinD-like ATPase involved in chromosome partitioning or flagellar assembly